MTTKPFCLVVGCISEDESFDSRELCNRDYFDSLNLAKEAVLERETGWRMLGHKVWFYEIGKLVGFSYRRVLYDNGIGGLDFSV